MTNSIILLTFILCVMHCTSKHQQFWQSTAGYGAITSASFIDLDKKSIYTFSTGELDTLRFILKHAKPDSFTTLREAAWQISLLITYHSGKSCEYSIYDQHLKSADTNNRHVLLFLGNEFWLFEKAQKVLGTPSKEYQTPPSMHMKEH